MILHCYPVNDLLFHETDGEECPCQPFVEVSPGGIYYIHNAWDGRE